MTTGENTMPTVTLEPCPLCGNESYIGHRTYTQPLDGINWADGSPVTEAFFVNCGSCGANNAGVGLAGGYRSQNEASAKWNNRPTVAAHFERGFAEGMERAAKMADEISIEWNTETQIYREHGNDGPYLGTPTGWSVAAAIRKAKP